MLLGKETLLIRLKGQFLERREPSSKQGWSILDKRRDSQRFHIIKTAQLSTEVLSCVFVSVCVVRMGV